MNVIITILVVLYLVSFIGIFVLGIIMVDKRDKENEEAFRKQMEANKKFYEEMNKKYGLCK